MVPAAGQYACNAFVVKDRLICYRLMWIMRDSKIVEGTDWYMLVHSGDDWSHVN